MISIQELVKKTGVSSRMLRYYCILSIYYERGSDGCMKYTDEQRIEKIIGTIEKLEEYLKNQEITEDMLKSQYSVQCNV